MPCTMHNCMDCGSLGGAVMGQEDRSLRKDRLRIVTTQTKEWLQRRGYPVPQEKLTSTQKRETEECFALLDADGSGTLDVDEVMTAFTMLGLPVKRFDILKLFQQVDPEGNCELQYPAFEKMMTIATADNNGNSQNTMPFSQVARAYHRAKTIEDMIEGGAALQKVLKSLVNHENMAIVSSAPHKHIGSAAQLSQQIDVSELCRSMDLANSSFFVHGTVDRLAPEDFDLFSRVRYCPYILVDPRSRTQTQQMKDGEEFHSADSKYNVVSIRSGTRDPVQIPIEVSSSPEPPTPMVRAREPQPRTFPSRLGKGRPCSRPLSSPQSLKASNVNDDKDDEPKSPRNVVTPPKPVTAPCRAFEKVDETSVSIPSQIIRRREADRAAPAFRDRLSAPIVPTWMEKRRQTDINFRDVRSLCEVLSGTNLASMSLGASTEEISVPEVDSCSID